MGTIWRPRAAAFVMARAISAAAAAPGLAQRTLAAATICRPADETALKLSSGKGSSQLRRLRSTS